MASVLTEVIIDAGDPAALGQFWGDVLGWPLVRDDRGFCWISTTGGFDPPLLVFVPVPEQKSVKNRLHLDVSNEFCLLARRVDAQES